MIKHKGANNKANINKTKETYPAPELSGTEALKKVNPMINTNHKKWMISTG